MNRIISAKVAGLEHVTVGKTKEKVESSVWQSMLGKNSDDKSVIGKQSESPTRDLPSMPENSLLQQKADDQSHNKKLHEQKFDGHKLYGGEQISLHPLPVEYLSKEFKGSKLRVDASGDKGFVYPQRLLANGYLSQLQINNHLLDGSDLTHSGIEEGGSRSPQLQTGTTQAEFEMGRGRFSATRAADKNTLKINELYTFSIDDMEAEPASGDFAKLTGGDPANWLKRHCLIVEKEGQLQIWLRDYHLGPREETTLVSYVCRAAQQAGLRVTTVMLNGKTAWRGETGL